jgi:hypothetical protein
VRNSDFKAAERFGRRNMKTPPEISSGHAT